MCKITLRVPAATANLGPGFDAFTGPDNRAPAFFGGLTASVVDNGLPSAVSFSLRLNWEFRGAHIVE